MKKMLAILAAAAVLSLGAPAAQADVPTLSMDPVAFSMDNGQSTLLAYGPTHHDPRLVKHRPKHRAHFRPAPKHHHPGHLRPAPKPHPKHFRPGPHPRG